MFKNATPQIGHYSEFTWTFYFLSFVSNTLLNKNIGLRHNEKARFTSKQNMLWLNLGIFFFHKYIGKFITTSLFDEHHLCSVLLWPIQPYWSSARIILGYAFYLVMDTIKYKGRRWQFKISPCIPVYIVQVCPYNLELLMLFCMLVQEFPG